MMLSTRTSSDKQTSHDDASSVRDVPPPYQSNYTPSVTDEKPGNLPDSSIPSQIDLSVVYSEPPPMFSRVPTITSATASFAPMFITAEGSGKKLDKGFNAAPMPESSEPVHPFIQHDITEADWVRFLEDVTHATSLEPLCKNKAILIPLCLTLGPAAFLVNLAVTSKLRQHRLMKAIHLINLWNQRFFLPRRVEVILMKGPHALTTCTSGYVPNRPLAGNHHCSPCKGGDGSILKLAVVSL